MKILAIDPGTTESAACWLEGDNIMDIGIYDNEDLIETVFDHAGNPDKLAIEMVASYGMAVGVSVFETVLWIGRFIQAFGAEDSVKVYRKEVKLHLCGSLKAKDGNVRQALIDLYGGESSTTPQLACPKRKNKNHSLECSVCSGTGIKREAGILSGLNSDMWSALAVAITFRDTHLSS